MSAEDHGHGSFNGHQLLTVNPGAAADFYRSLLGWTVQRVVQDGVERHLLFNHEKPVASILGVPEEAGEAIPHWHPHMSVDDVDLRAQLAVQLGGQLVVAPMDIPALGRLAVIQDPTGAVLTLVSPLPGDAERVPDAVDVDGD